MEDEFRRNALELAIDISEPFLDYFLEDELLQDIPVFGGVYKIVRLVKSIPDRIFIAKISVFIKAIEKITPEQRQDFLQRHGNDPDLLRRVGEALVLILNKMDDMDKPEILGKAFCEYVRGNLSYVDFRRICKAIDLSLVSDLQKFSKPEGSMDQYLLNHLAGSGLVIESDKNINEYGHIGFARMEVTQLGYKFQIIFQS